MISLNGLSELSETSHDKRYRRHCLKCIKFVSGVTENTTTGVIMRVRLAYERNSNVI